MPKLNFLNGLYLLNLALLFTHEIDSAYWQEWNLFGLPGGIQFFLLLNFLLIAVGLYGIFPILRQDRSARYFSLLVAAVGVFAFLIHTFFLLTGHPEFRQPGSIALLTLILGVSVVQGVVTFRPISREIDQAITFLKTRDLETTTAWYTSVLGLRLALDQGACRIFTVRPGAYIGFCLTEGVTGSAEVIFTLVVDDVDAACARLEKAGAQIEVRPRVNPRFNIYQFFTRDPNGYLIEVQRFL